MSDYDTEQCRTCQSPIIWTTTTNGRDMPVDAEPAPGGNIALTFDEVRQPQARIVAAHLAFGRTDLRLSHFVKCPQAPKWRQRR